MTNLDYILSCSELPFSLSALEPEADKLFEACPRGLMNIFNRADTHEQEVLAGDAIAKWIGTNWQTVLPRLAERFSAGRVS